MQNLRHAPKPPWPRKLSSEKIVSLWPMRLTSENLYAPGATDHFTGDQPWLMAGLPHPDPAAAAGGRAPWLNSMPSVTATPCPDLVANHAAAVASATQAILTDPAAGNLHHLPPSSPHDVDRAEEGVNRHQVLAGVRFLKYCSDVSNEGFSQLEDLTLLYCDDVGGRDVYEATGKACRQLRCFTMMHDEDHDQLGREALRVAAMHELRSLTLQGCDDTNNELPHTLSFSTWMAAPESSQTMLFGLSQPNFSYLSLLDPNSLTNHQGVRSLPSPSPPHRPQQPPWNPPKTHLTHLHSSCRHHRNSRLLSAHSTTFPDAAAAPLPLFLVADVSPIHAWYLAAGGEAERVLHRQAPTAPRTAPVAYGCRTQQQHPRQEVKQQRHGRARSLLGVQAAARHLCFNPSYDVPRCRLLAGPGDGDEDAGFTGRRSAAGVRGEETRGRTTFGSAVGEEKIWGAPVGTPHDGEHFWDSTHHLRHGGLDIFGVR
nr:unnamed protein product [Digitaria exilis]